MYTPNNIYIYLQAFSGAVAGLLGQSTPLVTTEGHYIPTDRIAGAWAQEVDTQWGVATNPDLFEYQEVFAFSNDLFQVYEPQPSSIAIDPLTYTPSAEALIIVLSDGETYLANQGITPPLLPGGGTVTLVSGTAPIHVATGTTTPVVSITAATDAAAGSMSAADKTKLDGITPGAAVASVSGTLPIVSSGGTTPAISINAATDTTAGSLSATDKAKLDATVPTVWTAVAAGGTGTVTDGVAAQFLFTTTGARCTLQLDAAPVDGQVVILKAFGASNTNGIAIVPGAVGQILEASGNTGTTLAAGVSDVTNGQGVTITYVYKLSITTWVIRGQG